MGKFGDGGLVVMAVILNVDRLVWSCIKCFGLARSMEQLLRSWSWRNFESVTALMAKCTND